MFVSIFCTIILMMHMSNYYYIYKYLSTLCTVNVYDNFVKFYISCMWKPQFIIASRLSRMK